MRASYLYSGNYFTGKRTSLYRDGPQSHQGAFLFPIPVMDFNYKDKTVMRPSCLYDGNSSISKRASVYRDGFRVTRVHFYSLKFMKTPCRSIIRHVCKFHWFGTGNHHFMRCRLLGNFL